jgi:hypothetical protein
MIPQRKLFAGRENDRKVGMLNPTENIVRGDNRREIQVMPHSDEMEME